MSDQDSQRPSICLRRKMPCCPQFARTYLDQQRRRAAGVGSGVLVWLFVAASMVWATIESVPSATSAPVKPHTALGEIRGEIASETMPVPTA